MIDRAEAWLRELRRRVSRSERELVRRGLPVSEDSAAEAGLLLIQAPGLARAALHQEIADGRAPFLARLLRIEGYKVWDLTGGSQGCELGERSTAGFGDIATFMVEPNAGQRTGSGLIQRFGGLSRGALRTASRLVARNDRTLSAAVLEVARGTAAIHVRLEPAAAAHENAEGQGGGATIAALDAAVARLWLAAQRSARREFDVWLYSELESGANSGQPKSGFALLPADAPVAEYADGRLSGSALRCAALHVLGRAPLPEAARPFKRPRTDTLRVMTYNVHSCRGMDGKLSPARIARVIARCDADVVALQELDVGRARTNDVDQAHAIARELKMEFHFHPALTVQEEQYGDALLSRYPMRLVRAGGLPGLPGSPQLEPRGAIWGAISWQGREIQIINTHLGLKGGERLRQIEALLGPDWLGHAECQGPAVMCGDFNAIPSSKVCRRLKRRLADAQLLLADHRPRRTFFTRFPIGRIDHVYVSPEVEVVAIEAPRDELIRRASDHLPLVVELRLRRGG